jgi:hypothetical protein
MSNGCVDGDGIESMRFESGWYFEELLPMSPMSSDSVGGLDVLSRGFSKSLSKILDPVFRVTDSVESGDDVQDVTDSQYDNDEFSDDSESEYESEADPLEDDSW